MQILGTQFRGMANDLKYYMWNRNDVGDSIKTTYVQWCRRFYQELNNPLRAGIYQHIDTYLE